MKRRTPIHGPAGSGVRDVDHQFASLYPSLWELATATTFDDGSPRQTSTFFWFYDGGQWKLMIKDRAEGLVAFFTGVTFVATLEAAEVGVCNNSADWRRDRPAGRRSPR